MCYSILNTEEIHGTTVIDLSKCGNEYSVGIFNKDTKQIASRRYQDIDEATAKYLEIVEYMIKGIYSFEERARLLQA